MDEDDKSLSDMPLMEQMAPAFEILEQLFHPPLQSSSSAAMIGNTEEKGDKSPNRTESDPGGIASALGSVALFNTWNLFLLEPKLSSVPGQNERDTSASSQDEHGEREGVFDLSEDVPKVTCDSKFSHVFPLYQDYLQSVKAGLAPVRRHSAPEGLSSCQPSPCSSPEEASPRPFSPRVTPCTLWQDLTEVKERGLLASLTRQDIRLQEAMFEMIASEASYLKSLDVVINHFFASKTLRQTLSQMEHHLLFLNLCHIRAASERFLQDLEVRLGENVMLSQVGDIILRHCPVFRPLYVPYVINMRSQQALISRLLLENRRFSRVVTKLERDPLCQKQGLKSFLVLPFQRITRLRMIMESILRLLDQDSESALCLKEAIDAIHMIVSECDEGTQQMKHIEELVYLEKLVDFGNVKPIPLIMSGRFLVRKGPVRQLSMEGVLSRPCASFMDIYLSSKTCTSTSMDIYLHLFNDLMLISVKKDLRYSVLDYAIFPTHVHVESLETEGFRLPPESFLLRLSQNHTGQSTALILAPHTRSDQEAWMNVLCPSRE